MAGLLGDRRGKQRILETLALVEKSPLKQEDVKISVAVVVKQGGPGAHNFGHEEFASGSCNVLEPQPNLGCSISEGRGSLICMRLSDEGITKERKDEEQSEIFQVGDRPLLVASQPLMRGLGYATLWQLW